VRNSSPAERSCAENLTGLSLPPKLWVCYPSGGGRR